MPLFIVVVGGDKIMDAFVYDFLVRIFFFSNKKVPFLVCVTCFDKLFKKAE